MSEGAGGRVQCDGDGLVVRPSRGAEGGHASPSEEFGCAEDMINLIAASRRSLLFPQRVNKVVETGS